MNLSNKKLLIFSHKECWNDENSPTGYSTKGGFPIQICAISNIFKETKLINLVYPIKTKPNGLVSLSGNNLKVEPLRAPKSRGFLRKLHIILYLVPLNIFKIIKNIISYDIIHCMVPGDLGMIGLIFCITLRKKSIVRHCGTWGTKDTFSDKILIWLLEKFSGKNLITLATGGGNLPPSNLNNHIHWIFSTTIYKNDFNSIKEKQSITTNNFQFAYVGRLSKEKNIQFSILVFSRLIEVFPNSHFHIIGEGEYKKQLEEYAIILGISKLITFYGNIPNNLIISNLEKFDVFLFPTKTKEGFPKAIIEAMAAGLIIFASNVSVLPYLLKDKKSGFILKDYNVENACSQILEVLSSSQLLIETINNAQLLAKNYSIEQWQKDFKSKIELLISNNESFKQT
ncbi:MAG: glycosyltransferase [Bacteroidia bacterium]|nr:glycosyltransferase [Bacteroidia bacterium]